MVHRSLTSPVALESELRGRVADVGDDVADFHGPVRRNHLLEPLLELSVLVCSVGEVVFVVMFSAVQDQQLSSHRLVLTRERQRFR